jgi:hypothetical protein
MFKKQLAAAAAAVLIAMPATASDLYQSAPGMMFFVSVPLDAKTPKQQTPALGLSFQGERNYQRVTIDTRMFDAAERMGFAEIAGISAKWIIVGAVATGAAVTVANKDKKVSQSYEQQKQQQQQQQQNDGGEVPCPTACSFSGRWY